MTSHSYDALYYPFIHFKDERWLKLSALYWDRMGRIVPEDYVRDDGDTVRALGSYVQNLHPGWVRPQFGQRFTEFIASRGAELHRLYALSNKDEWPPVPTSRQPPTAGGSTGSDSRLSYVFYEKMSEDVHTVLLDSGLALPDPGDTRWIGMHPRLAQVYMSALADQLAGERGLCPLTDETIDHLAVGGNTFERLAQALLADIDLVDAKPNQQEVENTAAFVAIQTVLPTNIDALPVDKILEFREKYPAERARFQRYVTAFVKPREWLKDIAEPQVLGARLQSEFDKELKPELDDLREKHRAVGIDTVYGVLTMQVGVPVAVTQGAALAGIAANPLLAFGAGAALAVLPVLRDRRKSTKEIAASDVSYMMRIERDLKPRQVTEWISNAARGFRFWKPQQA